MTSTCSQHDDGLVGSLNELPLDEYSKYYSELEPDPTGYAEDGCDPAEYADEGCDSAESEEEDELDATGYVEDEGDPVESAESRLDRPCDIAGAQLGNPGGPPAATKARKKNKQAKMLPIQAFFARYAPQFQYNPTASSSSEFYRLCDQFGWHKKHPERGNARQKLDNALVLQFNQIYGKKAKSLHNWKNLCRVMRIEPVPGDMQACRQAVRSRFVNLVDLVDAKNTPMNVGLFETERQLSEYTLSTGRYFPGGNVRAGKLLRQLHLRRHIVQPRGNAGSSSSRPRKGAKGQRR